MPFIIFRYILLYGLLTIFLYLIYSLWFVEHSKPLDNKVVIPIIVWWTPFTGIFQKVRKCSQGSCMFTENRSYIDKTKAFLFYGSDFKVEDLPLPRKEEQWWGLLHEESPKNKPIFDHEESLKLFNLTSTFKESSGLPLTFQYLQNINSLTSKKHFIPTSTKNHLIKEGLSPIFYLQSDCNPPSQRDAYVSEIANFIAIDSYGLCLNNRELPAHLIGIDSMTHPELLSLIAKYKFTIAFENSACDDYITEKLWRPLEVGSIPIYWGSPSIKKWLPNNNSIIHVRDFLTPKDLANHLIKIMGDDSLYEKYLNHKLLGMIENKKLIEVLDNRTWGINEDQETKSTFVEAFECYVCDHIFEYFNVSKSGSLMADKNHYGCPIPETMLPTNENNFWVEQWYIARAEAHVLSQFIHDHSENYSMETFYSKVIDSLQRMNHFQKFKHEDL